MAVLNNIRKHGIFLIAIIALALFAFILSSVIKNGGMSSGKSQNVIGNVNGEDISRNDFSNRVQQTQQNSQRRMSTIQAVDQVWNSMVQQKLIEQQMDKLGIDVGDEQIQSAIAFQFGSNPNFQTDGQFDINKLKAYIQQIKATSPQAYQQWLMTEQQIAQQTRTNVYFNMIQAGLAATKADAKERYKLNNTSFDLQYIKIPFSQINNDDVQVSDAEIKQYINSHKKEFKTKGSRDIRYVFFEEKASPNDEAEAKKELTDLLENHQSYNKAAGVEETVKGFNDTDDYGSYLAEFSDQAFDDSFYFQSEMGGAYADTLFSLREGEGFGPYKEEGYWKYTKLIATTQMPDSVKVKQILLSNRNPQTGQDIDRTQAEAEALADSLSNVIKKDSDKFSDLAEAYSDDPSTKSKGGEIGWLKHPQGQSNPLIDYVFSHEAGSTGVVETQAGYHVIYVDSLKNMQKAVKLATLAKKIEPSNKTENRLYNETTKFQIKAQKEDFAKAAKAKDYEVRPVKNIQALDENITGIGSHRNIIQWAFDKENKPGDITRFQIDDGYVVVQLTGKTSKGLESVSEASDKVKPILMKKKKGEKLKNQIKGNNLHEIAANYGTQVRTKKDVDMDNPDVEGKEPKVVGSAFALNKGETSHPIVGDKGVYVIKLLKKNDPGSLNSYNGIIAQETEKNEKEASQSLIDALKEKASISDRRAVFY